MLLLYHFLHDAQGLGDSLARLVGAIARGQRLEDVGDGHDAGGNAHLPPLQLAWIAGAIHPLVMTPGYFGHLAKVAGEGEALQHADGLDDVLVDLVALLLGKGAAADGEVVVLPPVVEVGGHPDLEAPGVVAGEVVLVRAGNEVNRLVGEQLLAAGQGGGCLLVALSLLLADAEAIVQGA